MSNYEDAENYVLFGMEFKATSSESNALSMALLKSPEAKRYTQISSMVGARCKELDYSTLERLCAEHAELEAILAEIVLKELKVRGLVE